MRFRPGSNPILLSVAIAGVWALIVGAVATVSRVFGPDDEQGSWGEVFGAMAGNFAVVFVICLIIFLLMWAAERRGKADGPGGGAPHPGGG